MKPETQHAIGAMWGLGDYDVLADRLAPAAEAIALVAGLGAGRTAVDLAAGTGRLSIALCDAGWQVSAIDVAPALVAIGERTTRSLGYVMGWHEASMDALPFDDNSFELAASSFGLIFAPDPASTLAEARRVLAPGGQLILSAWTPTGYMAQMTSVMAQHLPGDVPMDAPFRWGDLEVQHGWLAEHFAGMESSLHTLPWVFDSPAEATDFVFRYSPGHVAAHAMAGDAGVAMRAAVQDHLTQVVGEAPRVHLEVEYMVTRAQALPMSQA